jgi:heme-degrading monooxygenase HmoA
MIKRIVKLTFRKEETEAFIQIFQESKDRIRERKGCQYLELLRGKRDSNIFFTYSFWDSEDDLNAYRHSELFNVTWAKTKVLFAAKPEAWSVDSLDSLE